MNSTQPKYEDLIATCKNLEEKVAQGLKVKQALYAAQHELDAELTRFKLIERYGDEALRLSDTDSFIEHTVESYISTFSEPKCVLVEKRGDDFIIANCFGYDVDLRGTKLSIDMNYFKGDRVSKIIPMGHFFLNGIFKSLNMVEAIQCPFYNLHREISGLVISGRSQEDLPFYNPISPSILSAYTVMSQKVGSLYSMILETERLKGEIESRKEIEAELERRVKERTKALEDANVKLEVEIDERRKIEKDLEHSNNELLRSNSDLKDFAHVVSHDLKTPLRNVGSFAKLAYNKLENQLTEETRDYFDFIKNGIGKMDTLITDLLKYAQISNDASKFRKVDLEDMIEGVTFKLRNTIESKDAVIQVENLPQIDGNYVHLSQLFQNFIDNALKFIKPDVKPLIKITAEVENENCIIELRDNGIGIPQDKVDKVFSVFQRLHTEEEYQGTGIGLSICKKVIDRHRGSIRVASEVGVGTSFFITLPMKQA